MLLYRIGPEGFYAVAEAAGAPLSVLYSDPFETRPGGWELGRAVDPESAGLLVPIVPGKIVGIGRNYREHAKELDHPMPPEPLIFLKATSALLGPAAPILLPPESQRVEHEGEIAVVLRKRLTRGADRETARGAVLGVTCACDVTARDLQKKDATFARGKGFDTFCPLGPAVWVDADLDDLAVITRVNGQERQRGHVRDMEWGIVELLVYTSRFMTLEAGDVILTGTPAGVGPLADGDIVEVEIPGLGVLTNPVEALRE
ncbi:MAG TPA: fumarylacetoacetate hydrolase family protein [Thermoanaerobaculia bacterium]|nr:fumarylacetoacetate hydrolase family protein [Thermoanaerobaculia bacterium]